MISVGMILATVAQAADTLKYSVLVFSQGVYQADSFLVAMTRVKSQVTVGHNVGYLEYDFSKPRLMQAWYGRNLGRTTQVKFGQVFVPSGNDFPAPHDALFGWDPMYKVQPGLNDRGLLVKSNTYCGRINGSVAAINGSGISGTPRNSHRAVVDGNVNFGTGPYYASFNYRASSTMRYSWTVVQYRAYGFTLRGHLMRNENFVSHTNLQVKAADLEYHFEKVQLGVHAEKGYREFAANLNLDGKNRVLGTLYRDHGHNGGRLMVQGAWGRSN